MDTEVNTTEENAGRPWRRLRGDRGAVGTEMAVIVAIVVAIAIAVGAIMTTAATNHANSIPDPGGTADAPAEG